MYYHPLLINGIFSYNYRNSFMWSHFYLYYAIRTDANYAKVFPLESIVKILEDTGVLKKKHLLSYENTATFPWMNLTIALSRDGGFAVDNDTWLTHANLISVLCSRGDDEKKYLEVLMQIATLLQWQLIDENEDEDIVLYTPQVGIN